VRKEETNFHDFYSLYYHTRGIIRISQGCEEKFDQHTEESAIKTITSLTKIPDKKDKKPEGHFEGGLMDSHEAISLATGIANGMIGSSIVCASPEDSVFEWQSSGSSDQQDWIRAIGKAPHTNTTPLPITVIDTGEFMDTEQSNTNPSPDATETATATATGENKIISFLGCLHMSGFSKQLNSIGVVLTSRSGRGSSHQSLAQEPESEITDGDSDVIFLFQNDDGTVNETLKNRIRAKVLCILNSMPGADEDTIRANLGVFNKQQNDKFLDLLIKEGTIRRETVNQTVVRKGLFDRFDLFSSFDKTNTNTDTNPNPNPTKNHHFIAFEIGL
jgi:hypothetical protein